MIYTGKLEIKNDIWTFLDSYGFGVVNKQFEITIFFYRNKSYLYSSYNIKRISNRGHSSTKT